VESGVTTLLEEALNGTQGMKYFSSVSGNDGTCAITTTFDIDRNLDIAAVDVQNRASTALGRLPGVVQTTGLTSPSLDELCHRRSFLCGERPV